MIILNSNENLLTESSGLHYSLHWYLLLFKVDEVKVGYLRPRFGGDCVAHHGCKERGEYVLVNLKGKNVMTYCTASMNGGACTCSSTTSNSRHLPHNASTANQVRP